VSASPEKTALIRAKQALLVLGYFLISLPAIAQNHDTVYTVSLSQSTAHLVHVKIVLPPGTAERDLQMPVWDALYQVRDFSEYINWVRATDTHGRPLTTRKVEKSLWRVSGATNGAEIEYEILANVPGPYGAELNSQHAFFNLAQILMYPTDARATPMHLRFSDVPANWHIATALESSAGEFLAPNFDRLVDSPVEISEFSESDFDEGGAHYRIVVDAQPGDYEMEKIVFTVRPIVASETAWMNDHSFQTFLFIYHFPRGPGGGGMEHSFSTSIEVTAQNLQDDPLALAGVTAHEFFHLWNVKRIRPQSLEPRDYTREKYTTSLWFSEGFTNTVGEYSLLRSGFINEPQFLSHLASAIGEYERRPAHSVQSAEDASMDAWLEKYDYYRTPQRSISYYNKGELIGVLLDLKVRETSHGAASLRDVFQWLNTNYAQNSRFFPDSEGVRDAAEAVGQADFKDFFQKYVSGTQQIPWDDFFNSVGLHLERRQVEIADLGFTAVHNFGMSPIAVFVKRGSAAEKAGLSPGDSIVEINGHAVSRDFDMQLARLRPGDMLRLQIKNSLGKRDLQWKVGAGDEMQFELNNMDNLTPQQKARRAAWLRGESEILGDKQP
jgi:predicted metalloprotease with PDZ domain